MPGSHLQNLPKYVFLGLAVLACLPIYPVLFARDDGPSVMLAFAMGIIVQGAIAILLVELTWGTIPFGRRFAECWLWIAGGLAFWLIMAGVYLTNHELEQLFLIP